MNEKLEPLYTEEDFVEPVNTSTGAYSTLKSVAQLATGETPPEGEVSFDSYVADAWEKTVGENNYLDTVLLENSIERGDPEVAQQAWASVQQRGNLLAKKNKEDFDSLRSKLQELASTAVEQGVSARPSIALNNPPERIAQVVDKVSNTVAGKTAIERAAEDGSKLSTIGKGIGFYLNPVSAGEGLALDSVARKHGVPDDKLNVFTPQSETRDLLQIVYASTPDEKKEAWLSALYDDLKSSMAISDLRAASLIGEITSGEDSQWDGLFDFFDRLGVLGTVASAGFVVAKASKGFTLAGKLSNGAQSLATAGAKDTIVTAEAVKIQTALARKARLQATGQLLGEATGISTALDLAKLVTLNAFKTRPDTIITATDELQRLIHDPVVKLIDDLQDVVAAKGVGSDEAAEQLKLLKGTFSNGSDPHIHSVDNFELSADGTTITTRVTFKPKDASAFVTEKSAQNYIDSLSPENARNLKIIPDTSNNTFFVEGSVLLDLQKEKAALEAQVLEKMQEITAAETRRSARLKAVADGRKPRVAVASGEAAAILSKATSVAGNGAAIKFGSDVDKAVFTLYADKTLSIEDQDALSTFISRSQKWNSEDVANHYAVITNSLKSATPDTNNVITLENLTAPTGSSVTPRPVLGLRVRGNYDNIDGAVTTNNLTVGEEIVTSSLGPQTTALIERLGTALGMTDRRIIVLTDADLQAGKAAGNTELDWLADSSATFKNAGALHYNLGHKMSVIVMKPASLNNRQVYLENLAHEFGHAFEAHFSVKHFDTIHNAFIAWLKQNKIAYKGTGVNLEIEGKIPFDAMLQHRAVMTQNQMIKWVDDYMAGDMSLYLKNEKALHDWMADYSEFFAENFAKWAFSDKIPTDILGEFFKTVVDKFKEIAAFVNTVFESEGFVVTAGQADRRITRMLNKHIKDHAAMTASVAPSASIRVQAAKSLKTASLEKLTQQLNDVEEQLAAYANVKEGLVPGFLVVKDVEQVLDYTKIRGYEERELNELVRYALGDWSLTTPTRQYAERLTGINQQSAYMKLLTNYLRPDLEKLSRAERNALDNVLVLGDKDQKVFSEAELAGKELSQNARVAYHKVRALRDVMWGMRNETAAKDLIRSGYRNVNLGTKFDGDVDAVFFGKEVFPTEGTYIYNTIDNAPELVTSKYLEDAKAKGLIFYESMDKHLVSGINRRTFATTATKVVTSKIENVIPYRVGEYRRVYSDEYFVKFDTEDVVDGKVVSSRITHRTAATKGEAEKYISNLKEALRLHKAGELNVTKANELMQAHGWNGEELLAAIDGGEFDNIKLISTRYNRTDDDYTTETISLGSRTHHSRGDRVLSVHGEDTVNTLSPLDSIATEIGNTATVASITEWRRSHVFRWHATFKDILAADVKEMGVEQAFEYMLNNKGRYLGDDKRMLAAQRVQDYIVSQMNILTKEEQVTYGITRLLSEKFEGLAGTSKPVAFTGMFLRSTKDYAQFARTISFHSFFALAPVQFFMQGMNAFNAVALSPIHGLAAAKSSSLYAMALMSDQPEIWAKIAKVHDVASLGSKPEEFVETIRSIKRSGLLAGMNTTSLYGAEVGKYGLFNGWSRKARTVSALPFNAGEGFSRIVSFDIARREFKAANPGMATWTDDALVQILKRQDDLTQNMTLANRTFMQRGALSIPAQFMQYPLNMAMRTVLSIGGSTKTFPRGKAIQLLVIHGLAMGTAGNFLWPLREEITDAIAGAFETAQGEPPTEEQSLYVQQGLLAGVIGSLTDGEVKLGIGSRFNTYRYYEDIIDAMFNPDSGLTEILAGAPGAAVYRIWGGVGDFFKIINAAPLTEETLKVGLMHLGKSTFSSLNNVQKMRIAQAGYNQVMSNSGSPMFNATDMETYFIGLGIPLAKQEDLSIRYRSQRDYTNDLKEVSKVVGYHSLLAGQALAGGDQNTADTHSAIVQVILNGYKEDFNGYKQLIKLVYQQPTMTKLQKMALDQMIKQMPIKDFTVEGK